VTKRGVEKSELPPAVPNGWYYVIAGCQLAKGEVKHVSMLGELISCHSITMLSHDSSVGE